MQRHKSQLKPKIETGDPMRILIQLLKLLLNPLIDSHSLIDYIEKYRIDPNTYLPSINNELQIPLIYYCCSNPNLTDFFFYLIDHNVNLMVPMVCEDSNQQIELLYYSQIQYIPTLIEKGCRLNNEMIPMGCEKLLIKGNITKLITLYKYGAISKEQLLLVTQRSGLIFTVLDYLYERIFHLCQQISDESKLRNICDEITKNYINVFKLFFKNGVSVNQIDNGETFLQRVLNTYFIELIELTINYQPNFENIDFLHYSNFDLNNRQVMKIYYNDQIYNQIRELLKDKMIPHKINRKKPIIKKNK